MSPAEERIKMTFTESIGRLGAVRVPSVASSRPVPVCLPLAASAGQNIPNPGTAIITAESGPINGALDSGETVTVASPDREQRRPRRNHHESGCDPASGGRRVFPVRTPELRRSRAGRYRRAAIYVYGQRRVRRVRLYHAAAARRRHEFRHHRLQASHLYGAKRRDVFERQHRRADSRREYGRHSDLLSPIPAPPSTSTFASA